MCVSDISAAPPFLLLLLPLPLLLQSTLSTYDDDDDDDDDDDIRDFYIAIVAAPLLFDKPTSTGNGTWFHIPSTPQHCHAAVKSPWLAWKSIRTTLSAPLPPHPTPPQNQVGPPRRRDSCSQDSASAKRERLRLGSALRLWLRLPLRLRLGLRLSTFTAFCGCGCGCGCNWKARGSTHKKLPCDTGAGLGVSRGSNYGTQPRPRNGGPFGGGPWRSPSTSFVVASLWLAYPGYNVAIKGVAWTRGTGAKMLSWAAGSGSAPRLFGVLASAVWCCLPGLSGVACLGCLVCLPRLSGVACLGYLVLLVSAIWCCLSRLSGLACLGYLALLASAIWPCLSRLYGLACLGYLLLLAWAVWFGAACLVFLVVFCLDHRLGCPAGWPTDTPPGFPPGLRWEGRAVREEAERNRREGEGEGGGTAAVGREESARRMSAAGSLPHSDEREGGGWRAR